MIQNSVISVFSESFKALQKLRKQDLTKKDIQHLMVKWVKLIITLSFICFIYLSEIVYVFILFGFGVWLVSLIFLTSFFWVPLLLLWGPFTLSVVGIFYYTRFGEMTVECVFKLIEYVLQSNTYRRKQMFYAYYEFLAWITLKQKLLHESETSDETILLDEITCQNLGYAWFSKSGDTPKCFECIPDYKNIRQYQLYDYCVTDMMKSNFVLESCSDLSGCNLLDLGCGRGGGLNFLNRNYRINHCLGIDISPSQICFAQNQVFQNQNIEYTVGDVENLMDVMAIKELFQNPQWQGFDIITSIQNVQCLHTNISSYLQNVKQLMLQSYKTKQSFIDYRENTEPTFIIADSFNSQKEIEEILTAQFDIINSENASYNIMKAIEFDFERTQKITNALTPFPKVNQTLFNALNNKRTIASFQSGQKVFLIYVLKLKQQDITSIKKDLKESPSPIYQNLKDQKYLFEYSESHNQEESEAETIEKQIK